MTFRFGVVDISQRAGKEDDDKEGDAASFDLFALELYNRSYSSLSSSLLTALRVSMASIKAHRTALRSEEEAGASSKVRVSNILARSVRAIPLRG